MALKTVKTSGGDYSSLSAWEAGEQANLVSGADIATAECYSFQDTGGAVNIDGWTTGASNYIRIYTPTAERHTGVPGTGYRLQTVAYSAAINIFEEYVRVEGISINLADIYGRQGVRTELYSTNDIRISYCIFTGDSVGYPAIQTTTGTSAKIWNNIIFERSEGITLGGSGTSYCYNNTVVDCTTGITRSAGTVILKNNIVKGGTTQYSGSFDAASDYNASSGGSATGGAHDRVSQTFTFVNAASDNYHLDSSDAGAKDFGTDLSGDANLAFSDDIDGATRSGSWDIGADEVASAAPTGPGKGSMLSLGVGR